MGWRDFLNTAHVEFMEKMESMTETIGTAKQEFMEKMESMPVPTPLIPLIPFIPPVVPIKNGLSFQHTEDWRPEPKAWLEGDELRVQGVFDGDWPDGGLTPEIIRLTANNLPLQKQLLRLHVGRYSGPWWERLVEVWQEKVAALTAEGKQPTEEIAIRSAEVLKAVAFLDELRGGCNS